MRRYFMLITVCFVACTPWSYAQSVDPAASQATARSAPTQKEALLAQLHDIKTPDAPSFWPPALGWWLVLLLLLMLVVLFVYIKAYIKRKRYRHHAMAELNIIKQQSKHLDNQQLMQAILSLLKRTALLTFPLNKHEITPLWGEQLFTFFANSSNSIGTNEINGQWLDCAYKPVQSINHADVIHFAERWIKNHSVKYYNANLTQKNTDSVDAQKDIAHV